MAFDPNKFLAGEAQEETSSQIETPTFDPQSFLSGPSPQEMLDRHSEFNTLDTGDAAFKQRWESQVKLRTNAAYVSTLTGINADQITPDNYEQYAKSAGLSGNAEADFELVSNNLAETTFFKDGKITIGDWQTRDRTNKTNAVLGGLITNGIRALDEAITGGLAKGAVALDDVIQLRHINGLQEEVDALQKQVEDNPHANADTPEAIALRQKKVQLDAAKDIRRAGQRQLAITETLEVWEAEIRAGRVLEELTTLAKDEEFIGTKTDVFFSGMGSFAYSMSSFAIGGPVVGMSANAGAIYQETIDDARDSGASEALAFKAGLASFPAATVDAAIDRVLFTRFLKPLKGKMTVGELSRNITLAISSGALGEGSEQLWQNINAKYLTHYDEDRKLDNEIYGAMAMGAIFGTMSSTSSAAQMVPGFGKIRTSNPTDAEWDLIRKFETDEDIQANRGGEIALLAANGDATARALHKKLVTSTEPTGDQPYGPLREEPDLTEAEIRLVQELTAPPVTDETDIDAPLQTEQDAAVLDTLARADEDPAELTPSEKKLVDVELQQELTTLDEELEALEPELADESLSKAAQELAQLELTEVEGAPGKLTKEQEERLAAGLEPGPTAPLKVDKKTASFLARLVRTENRLNAKIQKLEKSLAKNKTEAKAQKLAAMVKAELRLQKVRKLAALRQAEAVKRTREKAQERLAKEVQKRLRVIRRNLEDRRELINNTKRLQNIIQQLPRAIRGDLNALFKELSQKRSKGAQEKLLRKAVSRVEAKIEGFIKVEQRNRLTKLVARGKKLAKSKGAELKIFNRIQKIGVMDRDSALSERQEILSKDPLSNEDITNAFLLDTFGGMLKVKQGDSISAEEVRRAASAAQSILNTGKVLISERLQKRAVQDQTNVQEAVDAILGQEKVLAPGQIKAKRDAQKKGILGTFRSIGQGISNFDTRAQSYEWLLDKLTRVGKDLKGPLQKYHRRVVKAGNESFTQTDNALKKAQARMMAIFGQKKVKRLARAMENFQESVTGTGIFFGKNEQAMSRAEAVSLWMQFKDKSLTDTFEKMGVTDETIRQVERFIRPEGMQIGNWLLKQYADQFERINAVHTEVEGVELSRVKNYSPISRITDPDVKDAAYQQFNAPIATARNANLQSRIVNTHALQFKDAFSVYAQHVAKMEHYISHAAVARDLRVVFENPQVKNAVNQTHGLDAYRTLKRFNDDIINGGVAEALKYQALDKLRTGLTKSSLALKPAIMVKQLTSIPAYADAIPAGQWAKGVADFFRHPREAIRILKTSDYINQRIKEGHDRDVSDALKGFEENQLAGLDSVTNKLMFFTRVGDIAAVYSGGWPVYRYHKNRALKDGKTESEAHKIAIEEFELATKRSQQSSRLEDLGQLQRGNSYAKLATMYMTAPASYYRLEIAAIRNAMKGRLSKTAAAKRIAIYHFLLPNIFQLVANGFFLGADDDDERDRLWNRQIRASVVGSFNGVLIFGDVMESIIDKLMGEKSWAANIPLLEWLTEIQDGIGGFPQTLEDDGLATAMGEGMRPFLEAIGIPAELVENWIKDAQGHENTLMNWLGWSDYALAEDDDT